MAEAFPVSGNIEPLSFPHLVVDLHRHGATGSLKVVGPVHPKALYFRGGRILFGSSNDPRDQLGAILIESGRITREQLDEVNTKVGPGNPLAKVLAESGFVNQRELGDAARVKVERILADMLSWSSGSFEFEDGVLPKGAVDLKLSTEKLLLAAVGRVPDRAFALRHVELATILEPAPEGEAALSEVRGDVWPLLERLDGRRTLKDAIALTRLDEFEAAKTACALLFLGIVRKGKAAGEELDLAHEAQSGFGEEAADHTVPVEAFAAARPVREEPAAFTFAEPEAPAAFGAAPEMSAGAETLIVGFPPPEPRAGPAPAPELPGVLPEEPSAAATPGEAPAFYVDAPTRALQGDDTEPGDRSAYVPPADTPPAYEPPPPAYEPPPLAAEPPEPESLPAPTYRPPAYQPEPEPAPAPTYRPPAYEPPARTVPDIPARPASPSRPSAEDLAALDALLHPSSSGRPAASPPAQQPRAERPALSDLRPTTFQPRPPATPSRRGRVRPSATRPSRVPLIVVGLGGIAATTVAAWYFFLHSPAPAASPAPQPTPQVQATAPPPPTTLAVESSPAPSTGPGGAGVPSPASAAAPPTPAASATPTAQPSATPSAAPPPVTLRGTPPPTLAAPKPTPGPAAPAGDARALLRQGTLPDAARAFAASLAPGARARFSLQVLVACAPENVQKAVAAVPQDELFIVPVTVKGNDCYRVCWGTYDTRPAAEAALGGLPAYFRQGGARPRVVPLAELLP